MRKERERLSIVPPGETPEEQMKRQQALQRYAPQYMPIYVNYSDVQLLVPRDTVLKLAEHGGYPTPPDIPCVARFLSRHPSWDWFLLVFLFFQSKR